MLQMAYFDRGREPVVMDIGPVLDLEDVAGGKVCALAGCVESRDYADTAAMLERYSPAQLLGFARRPDPGLGGRDYADAGQRHDQLPDQVFAAIGLSPQDVATIRQRFTAWPRTAEAPIGPLKLAGPKWLHGVSERPSRGAAAEEPIPIAGPDASRQAPEAGR